MGIFVFNEQFAFEWDKGFGRVYKFTTDNTLIKRFVRISLSSIPFPLLIN